VRFPRGGRLKCVALVLDGRLDAFSSFLMASSLSVASVYITAFQIPPWVGPKETLKVSSYKPVPRLAPSPIMDSARARYSGSSRKFVVALDIGTTFSGAAYAFLDPGQPPQIRSVTRPVLPQILDPVTKTTNKMQVPQRSESWVRKDSLYIIL